MLDKFLKKPFFSNYSSLLGLWLLLAVASWLKNFSYINNNYLIFRYVFWNTVNEQPLYAAYPESYFDVNHYGPLFSLVVAPSAIFPPLFGSLIWLIGLSLFLYFAVRTLPAPKKQQIFIYWFCAHELLTALFMAQYNIAIVAIVLLSFTLIENRKDFWAAFFIMLGTFVKLYGIVGLAFFFFSKDKLKLLWGCVFWGGVLFLLPMLISSPGFVCDQYVAWFNELVYKNGTNTFALMQNVSLLGMIRKVSGCEAYSDLIPITVGLVLFCIPYLRVKQYRNYGFRQTLLASVLFFTVLFSTGSESSSYIIALVGAAIWYTAAPWKRNGWDIGLMVFAFVLTSFSPSDLFPRWIRETYVLPYALKSLPCTMIWIKLCYEIIFKDYFPQTLNSKL